MYFETVQNLHIIRVRLSSGELFKIIVQSKEYKSFFYYY